MSEPNRGQIRIEVTSSRAHIGKAAISFVIARALAEYFGEAIPVEIHSAFNDFNRSRLDADEHFEEGMRSLSNFVEKIIVVDVAETPYVCVVEDLTLPDEPRVSAEA